jgi:hypothetical protein
MVCWRPTVVGFLLRLANMPGSLNQFVLVKARKSRGGDHWLPDDYDVRDSHGKVVGPHYASPASTEKTSRGSGR